MKILIINGNPQEHRASFEQYVESLLTLLQKSNHQTDLITLREKTVNKCIGCYSCWVKTPGVCVHKDDGQQILRAFLHSDFVLYASPLIMGFMSSITKAVQERLLPLMHPFIYVKDDRCQHVSRYARYPSIGLLLEKQSPVDDHCFEIMDTVFRGAKTRRVLFTRTTESSPQEIADEISNM